MNRRFLLESLLNISQLPQLSAPTISLSGDILSIQEVENAEYYDIYIDGEAINILFADTLQISNVYEATLTNGILEVE